jgi:hypothetical protein
MARSEAFCENNYFHAFRSGLHLSKLAMFVPVGESGFSGRKESGFISNRRNAALRLLGEC